MDLDPVTCSRLAALAFLHDIGKANRGFRARVDVKAPRVGHIDQLAWVFGKDARAPAVYDHLAQVLGLSRVEGWFTDAGFPLFETIFAHHGRPWERLRPSDAHAYWVAQDGDDPVRELAPMRAALDLWFAEAFLPGVPLPEAPAFHHAFAGLLMLADWLGSDERFFPFADGQCPNRMAFSRPSALDALRLVGLDAVASRAALKQRAMSFADAFGLPTPRPT